MRFRSECVPAMALVSEHQHDLAHVIRNLAPLRRPPPVNPRLAADLRSIAIEINQRHSFQDRNASDLQAALDIGEPRSPAMELTHETLYAALADVLASTPRLHA